MASVQMNLFLTFLIMQLITSGEATVQRPKLSLDIPNGYKSIVENEKVGTLLGRATVKYPATFTSQRPDLVTVTFEKDQGDSKIYLLKLNKTFDFETDPTNVQVLFQAISPENKYQVSIAMRLIISGINDEAPHFKDLPYKFDIPENTSPGNVVFSNITAEDADYQDTNNLQYFMTSDDPAASDTFGIDKRKGTISLKKQLDYETKYFYQYKVTVKDSATPPHTDTADVYISVQDVQTDSACNYYETWSRCSSWTYQSDGTKWPGCHENCQLLGFDTGVCVMAHVYGCSSYHEAYDCQCRLVNVG